MPTDGRAKWRELLEQRTSKVVHALQILEQLGDNRVRYRGTRDSDIDQVETELYSKVKKTIVAFRRGRRTPGFTLRDELDGPDADEKSSAHSEDNV
jgi:hypothetical protein